ncbi:MAG: hypothetical protein WBB23_09175 [Desulforhopalus sp.]
MGKRETLKAFREYEYPVDPPLPKRFSDTPNEDRPDWQEELWDRPYIERQECFANTLEGKESWFKAWPTGIRYDVRCLDGGAWDRPTAWGMFKTIEEAFKCCKEGPRWRTKQNKVIKIYKKGEDGALLDHGSYQDGYSDGLKGENLHVAKVADAVAYWKGWGKGKADRTD